MYLKQRLVALLLMAVSAGMVYYDWYLLRTEGKYYMKVATFGPLGVIFGIFLLLFPTRGGKPHSTQQKVITFTVFGIGLIAGYVNWFLMDPGFFGFEPR